MNENRRPAFGTRETRANPTGYNQYKHITGGGRVAAPGGGKSEGGVGKAHGVADSHIETARVAQNKGNTAKAEYNAGAERGAREVANAKTKQAASQVVVDSERHVKVGSQVSEADKGHAKGASEAYQARFGTAHKAQTIQTKSGVTAHWSAALGKYVTVPD